MPLLQNQPLYPARIDLSHPAFAGSSAQIICFGDQNGFLRNAGNLIAQPTTGGTLSSGTTDAGSALAFNGTNTYLDFGTANIPTVEFTFLWGGIFDDNDSPRGFIDCTNNGISGWNIYQDGTDGMYFNNSSYPAGNQTTGWTVGQFWHGALRNKGGVSCDWFRNGTKIYTGTGVSPTAPTLPFWVGRLKVGGLPYLNARFSYLYLIDRYLSDDLIKSLHANPWQIFESEPEVVFYPAAGSGAPLIGVGQIVSGEAFGTAALGVAITSTGIATTAAIGQPTVGAVAQDISGAGGITTAGSIGSHAVAAVLVPAGIASAESVGQPASVAAVAVLGIASTEMAGQPGTSLSVHASGIATTEALGSAILAATVTTAGIASAAAVSAPDVGGDPAAGITAAGISSAEVLGQPLAGVSVQTAGIPPTEAIGQPSIGAAAADITGVGQIATAAMSGAPALAPRVNAAGILSTEGVGSAALDVRIAVVGLESGASVGMPVVGEIQAAEITGAGAIAAAEAFGQVSVYPRVPYTGTGFQPGSGHRRPIRNRPVLHVELNKLPHGIGAGGIASGERFGYPTLKWGGRSRKVRDEEFLLRRAA
jgi:hypothetical protein